MNVIYNQKKKMQNYKKMTINFQMQNYCSIKFIDNNYKKYVNTFNNHKIINKMI